MKISKELLSEVIGCNITDDFQEIGHIVYYNEISDTGIVCNETPLNIYHLAHKCKEWAWKYGSDINSFPTKTAWRALANEVEVFIADTEPAAIFKACQWILDNKAKA